MHKKFCIECGDKFEYKKGEKVNTCQSCRGIQSNYHPEETSHRDSRDYSEEDNQSSRRFASDFVSQVRSQLNQEKQVDDIRDLDINKLQSSFSGDNRVKYLNQDKYQLGKLMGSAPNPNFKRTNRPSVGMGAQEILNKTKSSKEMVEVKPARE